jgi:hypothetical protein
MNDNAWVIDDSSPGVLHPPAPIFVLAVHEVALIQRPDPFDHRTPDHQESANHRIDLCNLIFVEVRKVVLAKSPVARE